MNAMMVFGKRFARNSSEQASGSMAGAVLGMKKRVMYQDSHRHKPPCDRISIAPIFRHGRFVVLCGISGLISLVRPLRLSGLNLAFDGFCGDEGGECEVVRTVCDHGYNLGVQAIHRCTEKFEFMLNCVGEETIERVGVNDVDGR